MIFNSTQMARMHFRVVVTGAYFTVTTIHKIAGSLNFTFRARVNGDVSHASPL